jgi:hypothetical protein
MFPSVILDCKIYWVVNEDYLDITNEDTQTDSVTQYHTVSHSVTQYHTVSHSITQGTNI